MASPDKLRLIRAGIRRALHAEELRRQTRQLWRVVELLEAASEEHRIARTAALSVGCRAGAWQALADSNAARARSCRSAAWRLRRRARREAAVHG